MRRVLSLPVLLVLLTISPVRAEVLDAIAFPLTPLLTSLPGDARGTTSHVALVMTDSMPDQYPWQPTSRPLTEFQLGASIPLLQLQRGDATVYAAVPIFVTVIDDFFESSTAPVIDSDYWFGVTTQLVFRRWGGFVRNVYTELRPVFHESTHLGDEVSLAIADRDPEEFYRINVSYEAWEATVGINEWFPGSASTIGIEATVTGLWSTDGYYPLPLEGETGTAMPELTGSRHRFEFAVQSRAVWPLPGRSQRVLLGSVSLQFRERFDFYDTRPDEESMAANLSLLLGLRSDKTDSNRFAPLVYLRYYHGQVPWGMYREVADHGQLSFGMAFGF